MKLPTTRNFRIALISTLSALGMCLPAAAADRSKVDVWYDGDGEPRRISVEVSPGQHRVIEVDTANPSGWRNELTALGIDPSAFAKSEVKVVEPLGNAHQLMNYRGFDRDTYSDRYSNYGYGFGYSPFYSYFPSRGHGHYCRPYRGGHRSRLTIKF